MSISLTNKFFANARGLTFADGGGLTWSFNKSTNTISAAGSGGGVLSSVGLADNSTTPIYTVGSSPLTSNGSLSITLNTQTANKVFAGPTTGAAAQPTFRTLVAADIPLTPANPSATAGLTAVNGSTGNYMDAGSAPPISQAITPVWTGGHQFNANTYFGGNNTGYTVAPNFGFKQAGTINVCILDTTDSVELMLRCDASGVHIGASTNSPVTVRTNNTDRVSIAAGGAVTVVGALGWNNASPPAQVTGFGSPTGAAVVANFSGTTATNSQMQQTIAQILTIMKAHGMIGA